MFLSHLSLTHFRNYRSLELDFTRPLTLFQGQNAHGKSNLLEAIYFLATSKSVHAGAEREVVGWTVDEAPMPHSRISATVHSSAPSVSDGEPAEKPLDLEILLTPRAQGNTFQKQIKINGVSRRAIDLVGKMRAVLFLPEDIKLVAGSPSERRRYLDIALCQLDRDYTRALARFQKVLTQRNSLLKSLREQGPAMASGAVDSQLLFWDEQLINYGSQVITGRCHFIAQLIPLAEERHHLLSKSLEHLTLHYIPSINPGYLSESEFLQIKEGVGTSGRGGNASHNSRLDMGQSGGDGAPNQSAVEELQARLLDVDAAQVARLYQAKLESRRSREIAAGITLYGPHRDDMSFVANGRDLRTYGSRGQQRSAALSLKLAEVEAMKAMTGVPPILLLDDVMSELDAQRRGTLLEVLFGIQQAIVTTTDWEDFSPEFLQKSTRFCVSTGAVEPYRPMSQVRVE